MNDKELAEALFELRVVSFSPAYEYAYNTVAGGKNMNAEQIVRDPRVAMALMDKCVVEELEIHLANSRPNTRFCGIDRFAPDESIEVNDYVGVSNARDESLPRAIVEACVEALI